MSSQGRKPRSQAQQINVVPVARRSSGAIKWAVWATVLAVVVATYTVLDSIKVSSRPRPPLAQRVGPVLPGFLAIFMDLSLLGADSLVPHELVEIL